MAVLDVNVPQTVAYAVPFWLRDEQIRASLARVAERVRPFDGLRRKPIAVACFGPSLAKTVDDVRGFEYVLSCSGAHAFLLAHGIVPTWHAEVDPRPHKAALIGPPHRDVEYLIASTCHAAVFDHLEGFNVRLWHVFDTSTEGLRLLPPGEWALTGGCSVGLRALALARFLGFTDLHVFGMDGSVGATGLHAAPHPNQTKDLATTEYDGVAYRTTAGFAEAARQTFHELDQMSDVRATFHGEGLVQHMARHYVPKHVKGRPEIAIVKEPLITPKYAALNARLHRDNVLYGIGGARHKDTVAKLAATLKQPPSVLDYGAGKQMLAKALPFPIWSYDPAVPAIAESPRPADLVICTDVLEHVEPEKLDVVLQDLRRCVLQVGYFVVHTGPAKKTLPDGRNTHLIQHGQDWWGPVLARYFAVAKIVAVGLELHVVVGPKPVAPVRKYGLAFGGLVWRRDPYPVGLIADTLGPDVFAELAAAFPPRSLFASFSGADVKYSLSERNHADAYRRFVESSPPWKRFHDYVKAWEFVDKVERVLRAHKMPLAHAAHRLSSRFEFSILPTAGGLLRPHRDLASKLATIVVGMDVEPRVAYGTTILTPKRDGLEDYGCTLDDFDVAAQLDHVPNQAVVFVRSDRSWHAVGPFAGAEGERRTITINVETEDADGHR